MIPDNFKPLLAATVDLNKVKFPCFVSRKLDGIRVLGINGKAMTRSMKEVPNRFIQSVFATGQFDGLDGEIIVGPPNAPDVYRTTNSAVMSKDGEPDFTYHVFDLWGRQDVGYSSRFNGLSQYDHKRIYPVAQVAVHDMAGLLEMEDQWLSEGYEGVMGRSVDGTYKYGRSTMKEGILWKLKRFADHEYEVVGFEERMHNGNVATINELGYTERSSHKAGMVPMGTLGALILKHSAGDFRCGTGFTDEQRAHIWENRDALMGRMAKIKHFEIGVKDLPRFPVFLDFRPLEDM